MSTKAYDLDLQLETTSQVFEKVAEEQGIDLSSLSAQGTAEALRHIMGEKPGQGSDMTTKIASNAETGLSMVDVALELTKRAAAEGLDLTQLDASTYAECLEKVASEMSDPEYMAKVAAWEQNVADMRALGAAAADGFAERLDKLAAAAEEKAKEEEEEEEKKAGLAGKAVDAGRKVLHAAGDAGLHVAGRAAEAGSRMGGRVGKASDRLLNAPVTDKTRKRVGAAVLGTGAAGAAGVGAVASRDKKAHVEEEAMKVARQFLIENGIDPDTGSKVASDEEINERAVEILRENGYNV